MVDKKYFFKDKEFVMPNRLYELRMDAYLNQDAIADIVGIATITYGRYERCERPVPTDIMARLANYYHVSVDYIIYRTDSQKPSQYEIPPYNVPGESLKVADKK